ncbi:Uma2 family endonuclease [Streptomyces sp. NPDC058665]|uniref:Uma2 family endonuclease n=1 Tax=Streptomyces sp. NPDC058665 TaxID=3346586 RepID=UPI00365D3E54
MALDDDRTDMASDELSLDDLFERLERMPVPEGYKVEIVEGSIFMSPQRDTHWEITAVLFEQLRTTYPRNRIKSDVRIDFPGHLNGFASDITALSKDAEMDESGRWNFEDIEFVAEVLSKGTAVNDYGPKKTAYATAKVPAYLVADPYVGRCHLYTEPKDGEYHSHLTVDFGSEIDLTATGLDLTLKTDEFPRD